MKGSGGTVCIISRGSGGMLQKVFLDFCAMIKRASGAMRELLVQSEALMQG